MRILGLDLSATSTGIAVVNYQDYPAIPTVPKFVIERGETVGLEGALRNPLGAYNKIVTRVMECTRDVQLCAIETPIPYGQMTGLVAPLYWMVLREMQAKTGLLVVSIENTRLGAMILDARKQNKTQVVKRFQSQAPWAAGKRWKADIVEAYYAAYYGTRFVKAVQVREEGGDLGWLSEREKSIYLSARLNKRGQPTGMLGRPNEYWYDFKSSHFITDKWTKDLLINQSGTEKGTEE